MEQYSNIRKIIDLAPMSAVQLRTVSLCFCLNMLDGIDVLSISFAAPLLVGQWGIQPEILGTIFSAALLGMMVGSLFIAPLGDTIGRRKLLMISLLLIAAGMLSTVLVTSVPQLLVVRFVTGCGLGGVVAMMAAMAAEFSPIRHRNFTVTLVQGGYPLGATLTGLVAAVTIPAYGWESVFMLGGTLTLIALPIVWFCLPESLDFLLSRQPHGALEKINEGLRKMGHEELKKLPPIPTFVASKAGVAPFFAALGTLFSREYRSATFLLWVAFFMSFATLYFLLSWVPQLTSNTGLSIEMAIYAGTAMNFGAFIGMASCGYFGDSFGMKPVITIYLGVGAIVMACFSYFETSAAILVALFVLGLMQGGFIGLYAVATRIYPTLIRSTGVGWAIGIGRPGGIIGPIIAGFLVAAGLSMASSFIVFAIPLAIAAIAVWCIQSPELEPPVPDARDPSH